MQFHIDDNDLGTDTHVWHTINVFDEEGNFIERVTHFDTETLLCTFGKRRQVVAAGFCFCPGYEHGYNELMRFLPAGLRPFVVTDLFNEHGDFVDEDGRRERTKAFIERYLEKVPKGHLERRTCKSIDCKVCHPAALYATPVVDKINAHS